MSLRCFTYMGLNPSCVVRLPGERRQQQSQHQRWLWRTADCFIGFSGNKFPERLLWLNESHFLNPSHEDDPAQNKSRWLCWKTLLRKKKRKKEKEKRDKISWIDYEGLSWQLFLNLKSKVWQNVIVALAGLIYSFLYFLAVSVRVWQRVLTAADDVPDFLCQI